MSVYYFFIFISLLCMWSLNGINNPEIRKLREDKYVFLLSGILVLIAGLRGAIEGTDTVKYILDYETLDAVESIEDVWVSSEAGGGYFLLSKLFSLTGLSVQWWFGCVEAFYLYALLRFVNKYSFDRMTSMLCYVLTGLFGFTMAGEKQTVAMAFSLLGFVAFTNKQYFKSVLLFVCGVLCHKVCFMILPIVGLFQIRKLSSYYWIAIGVAILFVLFPSTIWEAMFSVVDDDHFTSLYLKADNIYSSTTLFFYGFLYACTLFGFSSYSKADNERARMFYGQSLYVIAFQSLASSYSTAFRIAYLFLPFMLVLLPNFCHFDLSKRFIKRGVLAFMLVYFFYVNRLTVYTFFWQ